MRRVLFEPLGHLRRLLNSETSSAESTPEPEGLLRGESGSAMVEFAVIFWPQLTLTLAIIQFALLQYGYLIVQQAADLGARAAAVHDIMGPDSQNMSPQDAVARMAARQCALLAPGMRAHSSIDESTFGGGSVPAGGELKASGVGGEARSKQVYSLLKVDKAEVSGGEANCQITFDYVLQIPVGAQFIVLLNGDARARTNGAPYGGRYTVWPITRSGRSVAPWVR